MQLDIRRMVKIFKIVAFLLLLLSLVVGLLALFLLLHHWNFLSLLVRNTGACVVVFQVPSPVPSASILPLRQRLSNKFALHAGTLSLVI
mmetsp:Transcript_19148/g.53625  ORF Transcript_19148/g.53625 Transcript_19148/m.53625 type:complete len:89 (-) Transcript_19148:16-282(-)